MSGLTNERNSFSTSTPPPLNYLLITTVSLIIRPKRAALRTILSLLATSSSGGIIDCSCGPELCDDR